MSLTDRISKVCTDKNLRAVDLVKLGCGSKQTVSAILNGKQNPSFYFLEIFLKAFKDINVRWILTGEEIENHVEDPRTTYGFCKECIKKDGIIEHLKKECQAKDRRILDLEIKIAGAEGRPEGQTGKSKAS